MLQYIWLKLLFFPRTIRLQRKNIRTEGYTKELSKDINRLAEFAGKKVMTAR